MLRNPQWVALQAFTRQFRVITCQYAVKKSRSKSKVRAATAPTTAMNRPNNAEAEIPVEQPVTAYFLERSVGATCNRWTKALEKHPELRTVKRKELLKTASSLKALNYTVDDMLAKPMLLYFSAQSVGQRYSVLTECGFPDITITLLAKYLTAMNKSVVFLKSHNLLPMELDMPERLRTRFTDVDVTITGSPITLNESLQLKALRQHILNCYLRQRLDMNDADIAKLWKVYPRVRHKSFHSVQDIIRTLIEELQFPKERIIKNAYLLHGDANNVRRIVSEIGTIDGQDMREIAFKRPKVLMSPCDTLQKTLEYVKSFGIGEDAVLRCLEVLTLAPDTVLDRLRDLQEVEEFRVLVTNPRVLRLVHYQNKARVRLEYLNQLRVRCASLHILSCGSDAFAKYAREGSDRTKGRDIIVFLMNVLGRQDENDIRTLLSRHPNWCHIPVVHVKHCYDFLTSKLFGPNDIYDNMHLLLYPIKRIEEKLIQLQCPQYLADIGLTTEMHRMSNNQVLTLILYLIESEFHFTGDGVWTEQHHHQMENFHNLLPDFPESLNKVYKYGMRPAGESTLDMAEQRQ